MNLNRVTIAGKLTRDVEMRFSSSGTAIGSFGMALNRQWKTESGEKKEECTFVDVTAFGKQAELIAQYCKKGSPLYAECRLKLDQWDDKQTGAKRSKLGLVLEQFQFIGGKRDDAPKAAPKSNTGAPSDDNVPMDNSDPSVPF